MDAQRREFLAALWNSKMFAAVVLLFLPLEPAYHHSPEWQAQSQLKQLPLLELGLGHTFNHGSKSKR
jgi:hypothetical protein